MLQHRSILKHHNDDDLSVDRVCKFIGYSRRQLDRLFVKYIGETLFEYMNAVILSKSAGKLLDTDNNVIDVAFDSHYHSHEGYTRSFARRFSITPDEYRKLKIAVPLFTQYPANHYYILKEGQTIENTSVCTVTPVNRSKHKAEENIMKLIKEAEATKKNIIGGEVLGQSANVDMDISVAHRTNTEFWDTIGSEVLGVTALPSWGGFLPSEDKLNLLGDLSGKSILEIGCGNGRSLEYTANLGAADLWGLDISDHQLERTRDYLDSKNISAHLVCSPMEDECGLPTDYFDTVYSVYGIGWTTDLDTTFKRIYSYLKKDGVFIFGWSHPIHKCVSVENGQLVFSNSYFNEEWYRADMGCMQILLSNRMLGTYINTLANNGFIIEKLIEETDKDKAIADDSDYGRKALMLPTTFVIKATKSAT